VDSQGALAPRAQGCQACRLAQPIHPALEEQLDQADQLDPGCQAPEVAQEAATVVEAQTPEARTANNWLLPPEHASTIHIAASIHHSQTNQICLPSKSFVLVKFAQEVAEPYKIIEVFAPTSCYSPWTDLNKVGIFLHSWS
jgi:hypothetical protein